MGWKRSCGCPWVNITLLWHLLLHQSFALISCSPKASCRSCSGVPEEQIHLDHSACVRGCQCSFGDNNPWFYLRFHFPWKRLSFFSINDILFSDVIEAKNKMASMKLHSHMALKTPHKVIISSLTFILISRGELMCCCSCVTMLLSGWT